jgi:hypothetical protein
VLVEDTSGSDGPSRVNVRIPLQLLRAGVRLTSLIPPQALTRVNAELDKSGVPIDLTQLKPQDIEELIDQLDDVTVDVDDPAAKVQGLLRITPRRRTPAPDHGGPAEGVLPVPEDPWSSPGHFSGTTRRVL